VGLDPAERAEFRLASAEGLDGAELVLDVEQLRGVAV
jgi:hypothetical protein